MPPPPADSPDSDSDTSLLDALDNDNDPTLTHLRDRRLQQLKATAAANKHLKSSQTGYGALTSLRSEKDLLEITTLTSTSTSVDSTTTTTNPHETQNQQTFIIHFHTPSFPRCAIMNTHLSALASKHPTVRFLKIDVADAPFLVEKLGIRVLPCVISFRGGVGVDRVVGFEGVGGGGDGFSTGELERRFVRAGVLEGGVGGEDVRDGEGERGRGGKGVRDEGDDDDDDDDDEWD